MALRKIRLEEDPILRKISKHVEKIDEHIFMLLDDMTETMYKNYGVGLAAPQIGILKRIVVIDIGEGLIELINPEIIEEKGSKIRMEACLSFPNKNGLVKRPEYVKVKYINRTGKECIKEATELLAIALSHEIDHLNGILYIDKIIEQ